MKLYISKRKRFLARAVCFIGLLGMLPSMLIYRLFPAPFWIFFGIAFLGCLAQDRIHSCPKCKKCLRDPSNWLLYPITRKLLPACPDCGWRVEVEFER